MSNLRPKTMAAVVVANGAGPASTLRLGRIGIPEPAPGELPIMVHAAGIYRPDILQRMGLYPPLPSAPATLGLEVACEVVNAAGRWQGGDRICALVGGSGYGDHNLER